MNKNINLLREEFPIDAKNSLKEAISEIYSGVEIDTRPRVSGWHNKKDYESLIQEYSNVPTEIPTGVTEKIKNLAKGYFKGAVNWRSPLLQYNVGAAVNIYASAAYAVAMDVNVYNINDGLAGNMLASERTVVEIMANLAGVDRKKIAGMFTFGGTGT